MKAMRLQARAKMGYYPTPRDVVDRIRSLLGFPEENVNLLDPCCGEGAALARLAEGHNATTYGIELDKYRARQAQERLDHVLACSYEDARVSHNAFSMLYLNPPYDWQADEGGEGSERVETAFLRGTVRYVQPSGLLVYIVPQPRVDRKMAKVLAYRFGYFSAFRFPEDEYDAFRQVVILGVKKERPWLARENVSRIAAIPRETLEELPYATEPLYGLPASPEVKVFRANVIDEETLENELRRSSLWRKLSSSVSDGNAGIGRPPLPLHSGHLGLLLASGYLDGVVGEGDERHIVCGKVEKVSTTYDEWQGDTRIEREVERYQVSIKLLKRNGEIITLL